MVDGGHLNTDSTASEELRHRINRHLVQSYGIDPADAGLHDVRHALSRAIRGMAADRLVTSRKSAAEPGVKRVAYLSMEFLIGRLLGDMLLNLGLTEAASEAVASYGLSLADVLEDEPDPALGNGGLGRLAACYLESSATLGCPVTGYGLLYENGLFAQGFANGEQTETPEHWLRYGNPWDLARTDIRHCVKLGGHVEHLDGVAKWLPDAEVVAEAHDLPVIGWGNEVGNTLRLWQSRPSKDLDFGKFNAGDYVGAMSPEILSGVLTRVLYPDDTTDEGKRLRLTQEYFLTSASIQDVFARLDANDTDLHNLPEAFAVQLNDTHPTIAGPEIIRILVDERGFDFSEAVDLATRTLSYTNHTLLKEALEEWPVGLMASLLPRHLEIIEEVDKSEASQFPDRPADTAIIGDDVVRMGNLAFVLAHKTNGVSALHSELVQRELFPALDKMHPGRILNVTNGITPRRWLAGANPAYSELITDLIGTGWQADLGRLQELENYADDDAVLERFGHTKRLAKDRVADWLQRTHGISVDVNSVFDVQVKRIHEYKRQLLNILETIAHWQAIKKNPAADWVPRVKIFGGKAAPGYVFAKQVIRFINDVARTINADPETNQLLKVVYPANYNVSMAELLVPAADLSEQISTAGMEASGTGNMKFALNGALTIGTLDGANVEIREHVGAENFFLFGLTTPEVAKVRQQHDQSRVAIERSAALQDVLAAIAHGEFSPEDPGRYNGILENIWEHDWFLVAADFDSYHDAQLGVDGAYKTVRQWQRSAVLNTARMGYFSSDRAVSEYMQNIWATR